MDAETSEHKQKAAYIKERRVLGGDRKVDAAVIGGGMAGILTAHFLSEAGVRTAVLAADRTENDRPEDSAAMLTSQHGLIYEHLCRYFGEERARQYADANRWAIGEYKRIVLEKKISCGFIPCASYLYASENWDSIAREYEAAQSLGIPCDYTEETELPGPVAAALRFEDQARFCPQKFLHTVEEPLEIFEHAEIREVEGKTIRTGKGRVTADHIVFCDSGLLRGIPGHYSTRMCGETVSVTAWRSAVRLKNLYQGIDGEALAFCMAGELLQAERAGLCNGQNPEDEGFLKMQKTFGGWRGACAKEASWSIGSRMSFDKVPYIGLVSEETPKWYLADGFGRWEMTSAMAAARILSDEILERKNPWKEVFSPRRFMLAASAAPFLRELGQRLRERPRRSFTWI